MKITEELKRIYILQLKTDKGILNKKILIN